MASVPATSVQFSYQTLRLLIGCLGLSLPLLLPLGNWFQPHTSVSEYYYTNMRDYLEGVLFFLAFFLATYRPYRHETVLDDAVTNVASLGSLMLALFPTWDKALPQNQLTGGLVLNFVTPEWSGTLHNVGAGTLFLCFALMALVVFTRGSSGTREKKVRNVAYRVLGWGIVVCLGTIGVEAVMAGVTKTSGQNIFWPEAIALVCFSLSWLVKGGLFFPDKNNEGR